MKYINLYILSVIMAFITFGYLIVLMWEFSLMETVIVIILFTILATIENEAGKQYIRERRE